MMRSDVLLLIRVMSPAQPSVDPRCSAQPCHGGDVAARYACVMRKYVETVLLPPR